MNRRGPRQRLEEGISKDAIGLSAVVAVGDRQREKRYPLGTDLRILREWRRKTRAALELDLALPADAPPPSTLADDVETYLGLLADTPFRRDLTSLLAHWTRLWGSRRRAELTSTEVHAQLLAWRRDGVAAQTCNHRRRALVGLYRTLDNAETPNPAKAAAKLPLPRRTPRGLPWPIVRRILVAFPDRGRPVRGEDRPARSLTKIRAWVLATTGWPHAVLARLQPADLHLEAAEPYATIRPRLKGRGTRVKAVPLLPDAVRALRAWLDAGAAGSFSASSLRKSFLVAVARAREKWEAAEQRAAAYHERPVRAWPVPAGVRPYDLRHSFGVRVVLTSNVFAAKELLLHEDLKTTMHYLDAAVAPSAAAAVRLMSRRRQTGTPTGTQAKPRKSRR